jgi:hypothetical protein
MSVNCPPQEIYNDATSPAGERFRLAWEIARHTESAVHRGRHVTRTIWTGNGGVLEFYEKLEGQTVLLAWTHVDSPIRPGDYDLNILYVTYHHTCALSVNQVVEYIYGEVLFFGHNHTPVNDEGMGPGWWCA